MLTWVACCSVAPDRWMHLILFSWCFITGIKSHSRDQLVIPWLDSSFQYNLSEVHVSNIKACVTFDPASGKWIYDSCTSYRGSVCLFHKGNHLCNLVQSIPTCIAYKVCLLNISDKPKSSVSLFQSSWTLSVFQGLRSSHKSARSYIPSLWVKQGSRLLFISYAKNTKKWPFSLVNPFLLLIFSLNLGFKS